jgi:flagellar basal-body rod protein FlgB
VETKLNIENLKSRLHWLEARQKLVASNVANANTPGFKSRDIRPFSTEVLNNLVPLAVTNVAHIPIGSPFADDSAKKVGAFETVPDQNNIGLEDQMTRLADIQIDYQTAASLYTKSLGIIKTAIGRR